MHVIELNPFLPLQLLQLFSDEVGTQLYHPYQQLYQLQCVLVLAAQAVMLTENVVFEEILRQLIILFEGSAPDVKIGTQFILKSRFVVLGVVDHHVLSGFVVL